MQCNVTSLAIYGHIWPLRHKASQIIISNLTFDNGTRANVQCLPTYSSLRCSCSTTLFVDSVMLVTVTRRMPRAVLAYSVCNPCKGFLFLFAMAYPAIHPPWRMVPCDSHIIFRARSLG